MPSLLRYFVPKNSPFWDIPKSQYQMSGVDSSKATPDEYRLICHLYARNVLEARLLMQKHGTTDANKIMEIINRQKPTILKRIKRQVKRLVMKLEGSTTKKPTFSDPNKGRL